MTPSGGWDGGGSEARGDLDGALAEAHRMAEEGDWETMAATLRALLPDYATDTRLLCWLGVAERELGMEGIAYERFRACLAEQPVDPLVLATAGNALADFDDPEAETALRAAAVLGPDLAFARWMYGAYLSREGFVEEALKELQAARELDPEEAGISYELGVALALGGNHDGAIDELFRATELDAEDGWTQVVLGLALVEEERFEEARAALEAGARARPDDSEAQLLAALAAAGEDDDVAWEMLERARLGEGGADLELALEVEERLDEGGEAALHFLVNELAPAAYRERLRQRP